MSEGEIRWDSQWNQLIAITTANDLAKQKDKKVIVLSSNLTVREALNVLSKDNILSAPVSDSGKFIGFVDVLDICGYSLHVWKKKHHHKFPLKIKKFSIEDAFFNITIKELVNFSQSNVPVQVNTKESVKQVLQVFNTPAGPRHWKPHRVCVLDDHHQFVNIISQSDIIIFALLHASSLGNLANTPISELGISRTCLMVRIDSPFVETLELLYTNKFGGIALVDEQGKLSANFSASDLRGILPEAFDLFSGSILQYLCKGTSTTLRAPIACSPTSTLKEALELLATNKIHRLYVVDENERPTGIISLSDIIAILISP